MMNKDLYLIENPFLLFTGKMYFIPWIDVISEMQL